MKKATTSSFNSSSYQCLKDSQKKARYSMYTNSIKEQSIDSLMMIKSCCIFIKIIQKIFAFVFLTSNYLITYGWNGSQTLKLSPILKAKQQKIVRFNILIYNLDANDDFDEKNYIFKFNPPSFREFDNIYNGDYMTHF